MSISHTVIFVIAGLAACETESTVGSRPDALRAGAAIDVPIGRPDSDAELRSGEIAMSSIYLVGERGLTVLWDEPHTIDLLPLGAGLQTLLDGVTVPAGRYSQLRVVIDSAVLEVNVDGETMVFATEGDDADADGVLLTPSWDPAGYKAMLPSGGLVVSGDQRFLAITLDLGESFGHDATAADRWVMDPVIRTLDVAMTSDLVVDVWAETADLGDFVVVVRDESGNLERRGHLTKSETEASTWTTHFTYLDPSVGRFSVDLEPPPDVESFRTSLVLPLAVFPESGETDHLTIRVTEVTY